MAYTTAADLKTYLNITGTGDDALLAALVTRAQAAVERHTGRIFEASAVTYKTLDVGRYVDGDTLYFGPHDACAFYAGSAPDNYSIQVATSNDNVLPLDDATGLPMDGPPWYALRILPSATVSWADLQYDTDHPYIMLGALWAYSETPPDDIVQATIRWAGYMYRQRDAQVFDVTAMPDAGALLVPQGIPKDVEMLLRPYVRRL